METINNLPAYAEGKFVVARNVDGELWFYGAYSDFERATEVANQIDGLVVKN